MGLLSVIVPCYNEEENIVDFYNEVLKNEAYFKGHDVDFEFIYVNDGSKDKTLDFAIESKRKYPDRIFVVSHVINRGLGAALKTGMVVALNKGAKYIVTFDADGQHEIEDIPKVCKPLQDGEADVVIGARPFEDMPISKSFANLIMNALTLLFYGKKVKDSQSGLRAFTAHAADVINIVSRGYGVSSEFIKEISDKNLRLSEVTITTIYTPETQNKGTDAIVGFKILTKMVIDLFRI